ncbi:ABC transporter permease [Bradyrhizobium sp. NP1]|uniref:ABC transporter permease n=1 Tax=Bradyrhizobium sp. NP1 TaxID=3049772 RepID=UPI0025A64C08|nr:ABC transporter permease [Bradyrhizobium sp. NP1]WJR77260.1 ABC transporter permease [Bradyrhizobium sp. NP1]
MLRFLTNRLLQAAVVMLAVGAISFALFRYVGDPVEMMLGVDDPAEMREQLRVQLGLDAPAPVQFARYLLRSAGGDFGLSYRTREPVGAMIFSRLPATLELVFCATLFAIAAGIPLGIAAALNRRNWIGRLVDTMSLVGVSMPTFMTGTLLILLFSVTFNLLPSFGRGETVRLGCWTTGFLTLSGLKSLLMPSITLGLFQMTLIMRLVRGEMLEVLRADFIRFQRARGLPNGLIHFRHALRNSLMPVVTVAGLQLGSLIAFTIVTESVFQWPGMGLLFVQSINNVDVPVMAAYLMVVAAFFVGINVIVDILYVLIDPRLRGGMATGGAAA